MYAAKKFPLVIIFSFLFAFKPLPKNSDSYSKNMSDENLEVLTKKSCSTEKNSFNNIQPGEFPSGYSRQRDRNVEIPINYHVIYVAGDSIIMNVTVDNQQYPHCSWDIRDNDNNTFLLYPGFEFDYPGHSYSIGGILPPGNYSLFLYDEFGTGGVSASVTTSSGQVLASVNMGSWGSYTFLNFTAPEGDYVNGLISTAVIEQQTEVLNNAYNDFGYTFITSNIDSAVNAGWYYATDSHKFETGQWSNTDQYLAMAQAMAIDVTHSINYYWTGARLTSGLGVHPWSFPEDDSRHGLFCGNYTIPGGEPGLNLGITGVHEVGHYLGLYHTFENGCSSPGDEVEDTPYQSEANYSCPNSNYSCGSYDDIGNYMDYMDDECLTHFTQGQKDRIDWAIETYRPILLENTTLGYAGPVWYVATTGSDETGDGSNDSPFATIQKGIELSSDGDTVLVAPGQYCDAVDFIGKNIVVGSHYIIENNESLIDLTILGGGNPYDYSNNCSSYFDGVRIINGEDSTALFTGFTISGTFDSAPIKCVDSNPSLSYLIIENNNNPGGGALHLINSQITLNKLIIKNNTKFSSGHQGTSEGGAAMFIDNSLIFLKNSLVYNNSSIYNGFYGIDTLTGGIVAVNNSVLNFDNISFYGNSGSSDYGSAVHLYGNSNAIVTNSIFWNDSVPEQIIGIAEISYSNIQSGWNGEGNIDLNPLFCNPDSSDFSLAENSPCVGTGENGSNIGALGVGCEAISLAPVIEDIVDQQTNEDEPLTVNISASSQMGSELSYFAESDTSAMPVYMDGSIVAIGLEVNWNGVGTITVIVSDENGLSDTTSFDVTVNPVNDMPEEFTILYPTLSDTFSTHIDNDTAIPFRWEESHDVDSDISYRLTIELEFFGNTYTDIHENITDTTLSVPSNSLDPLLNVTSQDGAVFTYYVHASDEENEVPSDSGQFVLSNSSLSTINKDILPETFALHQNYPNPFNPITSIRYDLPEDGLVNITIYDMMGRIVKTLVNSSQTAGYKSIVWGTVDDRGHSVSAGLYIYSITAGNYRANKKMILLK